MPPTIYLTFAGLARRAPDLAAPRHPRRAQAPLLARQPLHRRGRRRPGHAAVLARHHADHRLRRPAQGPARLRLRHLAELPDARVLPGRGAGADHDAPRALRGDRGHEHGVHQDGARQGPGRADRRREARVPERLHPRHHGARPAVRPAPRRRHHHRDGVRVARRGHPHRGIHPQPGFPGGPVRGHPARPRHRRGEPHRRPRRGLHRSAHPGRRMKAASAPTKVALADLEEARRRRPARDAPRSVAS